MSGLKNRNKNTGGVLLYTLVINGELVDRDYVLKRLKEKGITTVKGPEKKKTPTEDIDVEKWLKKERDGLERNYVWFIFYLTIFCSRRWPFRKPDGREQFINIGKKVWDLYIPNSKGQRIIIKNILKAAEILKFNESYLSESLAKSMGKHGSSKSVALFEDPENPFTLEPTYRSLPDLNTVGVFDNEKWLNSKDRLPIKGDLKTTEAIEENLAGIRLSEEVLEDVEAFDYSKITSKAWDKSYLNGILSFAGLKLKQSERQHWNIGFRYHESIGRCYHCYSNFPTRFRHRLTYKGAPIYQIDCKAAHPFLLIDLYNDAKAAPIALQREKKRYSARFSHNSDFYFTVGKIGGIKRETPDQTDEQYRKMVKEMFWNYIYDEYREEELEHNPFAQAYQKTFPILYRTIVEYKTELKFRKGTLVYLKLFEKLAMKRTGLSPEEAAKISIKNVLHIQLNYKLNRLEGEIMIKNVCRHLVHKGIEVEGKVISPWFIPFHDAIFCQQYTVKPIKRLMREIWADKLQDNGAFTDKPIGDYPELVKSSLK